MGFIDSLKSIGGAFVETSPKTNEPEQATTAVAPLPSQAKTTVPAYVPFNNGDNSTSNENKTIDPAISAVMQQRLLDSLNNRKLAGFHYLAFRASSDALKNYIPDEALRMKAALNNAKITIPDASVTNIINTADECLTALKEEKTKFDAELAKTIDAKVNSRQEKIKLCDSNIEALTTQIATIQSQIEAAQKEKQLLIEKKTEVEQAISDQKSAFEVSFLNVKQSIENDKQKITQILLV